MFFFWYTIREKFALVLEWVLEHLPGRSDSPEGRSFNILIFSGLGLVILMMVVGFFAFSFAIQGTEQTMIPDVRNADVVDALIQLQEKELYPRIQVRFSSDPNLKGKVIDQRPSPGTLVKAGKRVTLVVSKGAVVDKVENYVGKSLEEVRMHLQTMFAAYKPLLKIKEPVTYAFSAAAPGTIIQQKPEAGTELTGLTDLVLVVSRGQEAKKVKLPKFVGQDFQQALATLVEASTPFVFSVTDETKGQQRGRVVEQSPEAGKDVDSDTRVELKIAEPLKMRDKLIFGLFEFSLPTYPVAVDLKFESLSPTGERKTLFTMKHPGGPVAVPYYQEENTVLILSVFNREIIRQTVEKPKNN